MAKCTLQKYQKVYPVDNDTSDTSYFEKSKRLNQKIIFNEWVNNKLFNDLSYKYVFKICNAKSEEFIDFIQAKFCCF